MLPLGFDEDAYFGSDTDAPELSEEQLRARDEYDREVEDARLMADPVTFPETSDSDWMQDAILVKPQPKDGPRINGIDV